MALDNLNFTSLPKFGELQTKLHECGNSLDSTRVQTMNSLLKYLSSKNIFPSTEYVGFFDETNKLFDDRNTDEINHFEIICVKKNGSYYNTRSAIDDRDILYTIEVIIGTSVDDIKILLELGNSLMGSSYKRYFRSTFNLMDTNETNALGVVEHFYTIKNDLCEFVHHVAKDFSNQFKVYEEYRNSFCTFTVEIKRKIIEHYEITLENICIEKYATSKHINIDNREYALKKSNTKKFKIMMYRWRTYLHDIAKLLLSQSNYYRLPHITRY